MNVNYIKTEQINIRIIQYFREFKFIKNKEFLSR